MKRVVAAEGRRLEYTLIQSVRRDVLFKVLPGGEVRVYAPRAMGLRAVDALVRERMARIMELGQAVDRRVAEDRRNHPVLDGSAVMIEGRPHAIRLERAARVGGEVTEGELRLRLPNPDSDEAVRAAIRAVLSERALRRIRERLDYYIPKIGKTPGRVTIREQKTRWGSCSSKGNLNFNWKLIMAPPEALDYVVIHELCHLYEFNHSPRFWALVSSHMPDYEAWKQWLKDHRDDLYL